MVAVFELIVVEPLVKPSVNLVDDTVPDAVQYKTVPFATPAVVIVNVVDPPSLIEPSGDDIANVSTDVSFTVTGALVVTIVPLIEPVLSCNENDSCPSSSDKSLLNVLITLPTLELIVTEPLV